MLITDEGVDRPDETGSVVVRAEQVFTPSLVLIVCARRGVGKGLNVETSQVDFDFLGGGRGALGVAVDVGFDFDFASDLTDALSASFVESCDLPLLMTFHHPEGLV